MEEDRVVRTSVPLAGSHGMFNLGSGYLVEDGLVLTASHVLVTGPGHVPQPGDQAEVAAAAGAWLPATVRWADPERDVALLDCPDMRPGGAVRWGRPTGSEPLAWRAIGFPAASLDRQGGRQPEQPYGRMAPASQRPAGLLALTVESREAYGGTSPWAGLSGAAVFCGDHLVGVITSVPGSYTRSLVARRCAELCQDPEFTAHFARPPSPDDVPAALAAIPGPDLRNTLRSRNASFTGRDFDIAALGYDPAGTTVLTQSLVGLGGVGKSALALEYAHRQLRSGQVAIAWWFVAEERPVLLASMARLYGLLTGTAASGEDAEAGAIALRNWLERSPYRWLVVFDNAEPGTIDGLVPAHGTGQVIITSRSRDWPGATSTQIIGTLPPAEATDLLFKLTGKPADDAARQLVTDLDGLALAIEQAGAYIRQTYTSYQDYLNALRQDPQAVYDVDLAHAESVAARVWRRSLQRVTNGQDGHAAEAVLGVIAYLAPDDIPREFFAPDAIGQTAILSKIGAVRLNVALAELASYSLIRLEAGAAYVHRVVQHIARLEASQDGRAAALYADAVALVEACG